MSDSNNPHPSESPPPGESRYRSRLILGFSLFALFFIYYLGTAVIQTPTCKHIASIPCLGLPLGLLLSLGIFPVSWALIVVFFVKGR